MLTPGQATDSPRFIPVMDKIRVRGPVGRPRTRPSAAPDDKAYSSRANRAYLRKRHIKAVIPEKADQAANRKKEGTTRRPPAQPRHRPLQRATRYDKTPESHEAGLHLRGAIIWLRSLPAPS